MRPKPLPPIWSTEELEQDSARATDIFRKGRLAETKDTYNLFYDNYEIVVRKVVRRLRFIGSWTPEYFGRLLRDDRHKKTLSYLTAPPISEGDLRTVARITLAPTKVAADPVLADRLRKVIIRLLDARRFPWVGEGRRPTRVEFEAAVKATTALLAASKVISLRRSDAKSEQEGKVKVFLENLGFEEVPVRDIPGSAQGPKPGEFMGETTVAGSQGDIIAGLHDGRMLIIECKVSNTAVNSRKRLLHDTGGKATTWYNYIGKANIVVVGVLRGVFGVNYMETAQNEKGVSLIWEHRLEDLDDFIERTGGA